MINNVRLQDLNRYVLVTKSVLLDTVSIGHHPEGTRFELLHKDEVFPLDIEPVTSVETNETVYRAVVGEDIISPSSLLDGYRIRIGGRGTGVSLLTLTAKAMQGRNKLIDQICSTNTPLPHYTLPETLTHERLKIINHRVPMINSEALELRENEIDTLLLLPSGTNTWYELPDDEKILLIPTLYYLANAAGSKTVLNKGV